MKYFHICVREKNTQRKQEASRVTFNNIAWHHDHNQYKNVTVKE